MIRSLALQVVSTALHRYPLAAGCGRLANTGPMRWLTRTRDPWVLVRLRGGVEMEVPSNDFVGRALALFGDLDPRVTWFIRHVVRRGDTVVDIGAHAGLTTLTAARCAGSTGSVEAVEPQFRLAGMVRKAARRNGLSNVTVHRMALSDEDGVSELTIPDRNSGMASLDGASGSCRTERVPTRHAGRFVESLDRSQFRLVKLDVEGHEDRILTAASEALDRLRVDYFLFEYRDTSRFWERPAVAVLTARGYRLLALRGRLRPYMQPLSPGKPTPRGTYDFVAVHPSVVDGLADSVACR